MTKEEVKRRLEKCSKGILVKVLVLVLDRQLDSAGVDRVVELAEAFDSKRQDTARMRVKQ